MPVYTQMLAGFRGLGSTLAPRGPRRQAATVRTVITAQQRPPTLAALGDDTSDWVSSIDSVSSGVSQVANALQPKAVTIAAPAANNTSLYLILGGVGLLGIVGLMAMRK